MSLLGFESLGLLALGQLPEGTPFSQSYWEPAVRVRAQPKEAAFQANKNLYFLTQVNRSQTGTKLVGGSSVSTINYTGINVLTGDSVLMVTLALGASATTSGWTATWDAGGTNQAMTLVQGQTIAAGGQASAVLFGLRSPTPGQKTLTLTWTGAQFPVVDAVTYVGVDTTSDAIAFTNRTNTTAASSLNVTSAVNNKAIGLLATQSFASFNQTPIYSDSTTAGADSAASDAPGAPTVTFTVTTPSGATVIVGCNLTFGSGTTPFFGNPINQPKPVNVPAVVGFLGPNLAINTTIAANPFIPSDWSKPLNIPGAPFPYYPNIALLNPVAANPFIPSDWSKPLNIPGAPFPNYPNLVLGSVPTRSFDWSKPFNIPGSPFPNYPNIVLGVVYPPLAKDWSKPSPVASVPTTQYPNIALQPTVVQNPFTPSDFSKTTSITGGVFANYPNIVLQPTVVQNPLVPTDWSKTSTLSGFSYTSYPNLVLQQFSTPFRSTDFSKVFTNRTTTQDILPNIVLLTPVVTNPFFTQDFSTSKSTARQPDQLYPNIVLNAPVVIIQSPFFTQDFSRPFTPVPAKPDQQSVNLNLFTNPIPFGPYDYPRIVPTRFLPFDTNGYPNVVLPNSSTPFVSYDWSKPLAVKASIDPQYPNIVVLQPVLPPFSQLDWSKAYTIAPKATNQNDLPNLLLIQPSIPGKPLGINGWIDWSYVKGPVIIVPDQNNLPNIVLLVTPPLPPPPDVIPSGKWRWLDGYNERIEPKRDVSGDIKKAAAVLSKMGGHARAQALTSTQRSNIATTAANARWNPKR